MKVEFEVDVRKLIERGDMKTLKLLLQDQSPGRVLDIIEDLDTTEKVVIFRLLPQETAAEVFSQLEPDEQLEIIEALKKDITLKNIIASMEPSDRAELLDEMPPQVVQALLQLMSPDERKETLEILNYPENSAGRLLNPRFIVVRGNTTVRDALEMIRKQGKSAATIDTVFVVDDSGRLTGTVDLKDLITSPDEISVEEIADREPLYVLTTDDQEEVAHLMRRHELYAVPVVDASRRLVGVVTLEDVVHIIDEEATEDIQKMAAVTATYTSYFHTKLTTFFGKRFPWLAVLLILESMNSIVVSRFEALISAVPILAAFMTIMVGTGGNAGAQISALVIRGMALGELKMKDWLRVFWREVFMGIILGGSLGVLLFARAFFITNEVLVNIAASLALFLVIVYSNILGALLPFLGKLLRIDPAVMAGPVITTIVDVGGMLIYFVVAHELLGI